MSVLSTAYWQGIALSYGAYGLAFNSFIEAIFFPIPPDVLLAVLCVSDPDNAFLYALIATVSSSIGGVVGYYMGYFGGKPLALRFFGKEKVNRVHRLYQSYESVIILVAGFTPLPYKLFTITSGVLFASLSKLFIFSLIGRGTRFFAEALLLYLYGPRIVDFLKVNLNILFTISGFLILLGFLLKRRLRRGVLP